MLDIQETDSGIIIKVKVSPKSSADEISGEHGDALKVSVKDPPEKGKANKAVVRTIAKWLGLPPSRVALKSGGKSKIKKLEISGVTKKDFLKCME